MLRINYTSSEKDTGKIVITIERLDINECEITFFRISGF